MIDTSKINFINTIANTDKFAGPYRVGHNYWPLYKNFITKDLEIMLEIGTAYGGFAKFMKDNNFPCKVIGAEFDPKNHGQNHVSDRTDNNFLYDDMYIGDAFCHEFLSWNAEKQYKYDLVIEDADHGFEHQLWGLQNCERLLKTNGVYIVEDIQTYEIANTLFANMPPFLKRNSYIWDGIQSVGRYDDLCIVVDLR